MTIRWSNSLDWVLQRCHRRFWFHHLHADWRAKWGTAEREAFILRNVSTFDSWRGNLAHSVIQNQFIPAIRKGVIPTENSLHLAIQKLADKQIEFSAKKLFRSKYMSKSKAGDSYAALWKDEFGEPVSRLTPEQAISETKLALSNLLKHTDLLDTLLRATWIEPEASIELVGRSKVSISGRIDLLAIVPKQDNTSSNELYLIDWKLARNLSYDYAPQLWLYAYLLERAKSYQNAKYQAHEFPKEINKLPKRLFEVNLLAQEISETEWNSRRRVGVENRIFRNVRQLNAILDEPENHNYDPLDFSTTDNPNNCMYCPFRAPCQSISRKQ